MAVYEAYIYYIDRGQLDEYAIGPDELKTGEILLKKAKNRETASDLIVNAKMQHFE